jgi:hypothetical protein
VHHLNIQQLAPPRTPGSALTGAERSLSGDKATRDLAAADTRLKRGLRLERLLCKLWGAASLQSAAEEQEAVKAQQAAIDAKRERRKRLFEDIAERTLGRVKIVSQRDIEGVQEARLADGEFVIPADVVADIGNGSSDAGSKKLYDMMDRSS